MPDINAHVSEAMGYYTYQGAYNVTTILLKLSLYPCIQQAKNPREILADGK
nr:hypothetical protein [Halomonas sp.]